MSTKYLANFKGREKILDFQRIFPDFFWKSGGVLGGVRVCGRPGGVLGGVEILTFWGGSAWGWFSENLGGVVGGVGCPPGGGV